MLITYYWEKKSHCLTGKWSICWQFCRNPEYWYFTRKFSAHNVHMHQKTKEENSMAVPQKMKHRIIMWPSHSISGYIHKRTECRDSNRYLYTHVHRSIIHNGQKVEANVGWKTSIDRWMYKQNVVYAYKVILFHLKKEGNSFFFFLIFYLFIYLFIGSVGS